MKVRSIFLAASAIVIALTMAACSQAAPATPTQAPIQPAAPTAAPAAAKPAEPTAVPAPAKAAYPEKGKAVMMIVPYGAGGATDIQARILAPLLEKELGTPVQVLNKPEAGAQVGLMELTEAKPDGYTIAYTNVPHAVTIYLDPERKAAFNGASFQPIAMQGANPHVVVVKADSPYTNLNELMDAAKASPGKVKGVVAGVLGDGHLALLELQRTAGAQFAVVNETSGGAAPATSLLGGHTDFGVQSLGNWTAQIKSGELRAIAVLDRTESPFLPGVKTAEAQGYNVYFTSTAGVSAPAGTPKEVVDVLAAAVKRAMDAEEHKTRLADMWMHQRYMDPAEYTAFWGENEAMLKPLIEAVRKQ